MANESDEEILRFMYANMQLSPRQVAEHFGVPKDRIHDILRRDLSEILTGDSK